MSWKQKEYDKERMQSLSDDGILPMLATIVANRPNDICNKSDIKKYVQCEIEDIADPLQLSGMDTAVKTVAKCDREKTVLIFGDYDVDGVTSSYLCRKVLRKSGFKDVKVFLPHRKKDGYGLNDNSVANLLDAASDLDVGLFVILDCGSSSRDQIEKLKTVFTNAMFLVFDHHIIDPENFSGNAEAVINPRIGKNELFCTGGLMYQFARAVHKDLKQEEYLPYAAIATVADVCHMQGSNRIIVRKGLQETSNVTDMGLKRLMNTAEIDPCDCTEDDIGFGIAPMINAAGRLSSATRGLKLLECTNLEEADSAAKGLQAINDERKNIQNEILDEAENMIVGKMDGKKTIVVHGENWNIGVVGIVAGRLAEKYTCPVICFGNDEGTITGSARSRGGIHIKEAMDNCKDIFLRYGGHEQAAGATLNPEFLDVAWDRFDRAVKEQMVKKGMLSMPFIYDAEIDTRILRNLNDSFAERLAQLGPFGNGNEKPILRANGLKCKMVHAWKKGSGGFLKFDKIGMECYAMVPDLKSKIEGKTVDVLFQIERCFMDDVKWAVRVLKARIADV